MHLQAALYHLTMEAVGTYVLAGGKSSRMGSDKALLQLDGKPLVTRALDLARSVTAAVALVGDPAKYSTFGPVVPDIYPDRGPLGGIHAALFNSGRDWNLILGVDLPFLEARFLQYLVAEAQSSGTVVTVPFAKSYYQPLCAVYRKQFAPIAGAALASGKNKVDALFAEISARVIGEDEIVAAGFSTQLFRNLNTREDWEQAEQEFESRARA